MVDVVDDGDGGFSWCVPLLLVDEIADLEVEREVWTEVLGGTGLCYVALKGGWTGIHAESIADRHAGRCCFHDGVCMGGWKRWEIRDVFSGVVGCIRSL